MNLKRILTGLIGFPIVAAILILGNIILFIRFKINIIEGLLLLALSILIPLVSHFIGLIVNLKYPKLDAENSTEIIKQSSSSFISVMIGIILLIITVFIVTTLLGKISSLIILLISTLVFLIIDILLYIYLVKIGTKQFEKLSV